VPKRIKFHQMLMYCSLLRSRSRRSRRKCCTEPTTSSPTRRRVTAVNRNAKSISHLPAREPARDRSVALQVAFERQTLKPVFSLYSL
jgi:hypothetical protein